MPAVAHFAHLVIQLCHVRAVSGENAEAVVPVVDVEWFPLTLSYIDSSSNQVEYILVITVSLFKHKPIRRWSVGPPRWSILKYLNNG